MDVLVWFFLNTHAFSISRYKCNVFFKMRVCIFIVKTCTRFQFCAHVL